MKTLALISVLFGLNAFAEVNFSCEGKSNDKLVTFDGRVQDLSDPKSGLVHVNYGGREVAQFDGSGAEVNIIFLTFKVRNNHGESLEGRVTSIGQKTGTISSLKIPSYGIHIKNLPIRCVEKKIIHF